MVVLTLVLLMAVGVAFAGQGLSERARRMKLEKKVQLKAGYMAPIIKLKSLDGKEETDLKKLRGKKPVVLLFGSYT